jgi:hypothetical protein
VFFSDKATHGGDKIEFTSIFREFRTVPCPVSDTRRADSPISTPIWQKGVIYTI